MAFKFPPVETWLGRKFVMLLSACHSERDSESIKEMLKRVQHDSAEFRNGVHFGRKQIAVALEVAAKPLLSVAKQCKGFALEPRT